MADYSVRIDSMESSANGDVRFDCWIQRDDGGDWVDVANGHRTMVLSGPAVLAITNGPGTIVEQRVALLALFRETAKNWGIDESDEAVEDIVALLPSPLPIRVNL